MEADWEVELGHSAPVIDANWPGFVDLRTTPDRTTELPEVARLPSLAQALACLNSQASPVWTAKCDVWQPDAFDPDELDAQCSHANEAIACYMDLLPRREDRWPDLDGTIADCRTICDRLRSASLRNSRVDLVVRRAYLNADCPAIGITAYVTACGATMENAADTLGSALRVLVASIAGVQCR